MTQNGPSNSDYNKIRIVQLTCEEAGRYRGTLNGTSNILRRNGGRPGNTLSDGKEQVLEIQPFYRRLVNPSAWSVASPRQNVCLLAFFCESSRIARMPVQTDRNLLHWSAVGLAPCCS